MMREHAAMATDYDAARQAGWQWRVEGPELDDGGYWYHPSYGDLFEEEPDTWQWDPLGGFPESTGETSWSTLAAAIAAIPALAAESEVRDG